MFMLYAAWRDKISTSFSLNHLPHRNMDLLRPSNSVSFSLWHLLDFPLLINVGFVLEDPSTPAAVSFTPILAPDFELEI